MCLSATRRVEGGAAGVRPTQGLELVSRCSQHSAPSLSPSVSFVFVHNWLQTRLVLRRPLTVSYCAVCLQSLLRLRRCLSLSASLLSPRPLPVAVRRLYRPQLRRTNPKAPLRPHPQQTRKQLLPLSPPDSTGSHRPHRLQPLRPLTLPAPKSLPPNRSLKVSG